VNPIPRISIVMPIYNGTTTVGRALESIFAQTFQDFEVIIVDDASTDELCTVLTQIADPRIRLLRHDANIGAGAARNTGIRAARGEYVALIDCDDEWMPQYLARQLGALESSAPETAASLVSFSLARDLLGRRELRLLKASQDWYSLLLGGCNVNAGSGLMVRRAVYKTVGYYDESLKRFEDWDWLLRCAAVYPLTCVPEVLSIYHSGPDWPSPATVERANEQIWLNHQSIAAARSPEARRKLQSTLHYEQAAALFHDHRITAAIMSTLRSIWLYPYRGLTFYWHLVLRSSDGLRQMRFASRLFGRPGMSRGGGQKSGRIMIVHIINDLEIGGAENMLLKLVTHMDRSRFDNIVVSITGPGKLGPAFAECGIQVISLDMKRDDFIPRGLFRMIGVLRSATILQTWLYHADLLGLLAGTIARTPAILWNLRCSDMDMSHYSLRSKIILRVLVHLSHLPTMVIANSQSGKAIHERIGYRPKAWRIIPNGFDVNVFRPDPEARAMVRRELGIENDQILIGFPARFDPMKDHANFFAAARILVQTTPRVRFLAMGKNIDDRNYALTEMIRLNGLSDMTFLLGEQHDMPRQLNALDIVTLASAFGEGFSNVLAESMAVGIPCVSTAVGDARLIVGDTGRIIAPRDPIALAQAWRELIDVGPDSLKAAGLGARRRIVENFSLSAIVREYERLYEDVIAQASKMRM